MYLPRPAVVLPTGFLVLLPKTAHSVSLAWVRRFVGRINWPMINCPGGYLSRWRQFLPSGGQEIQPPLLGGPASNRARN
jgi:hypothetical protein